MRDGRKSADALESGDGAYAYAYDDGGNRTARYVDTDSSGTLNLGDASITRYTWDHRTTARPVWWISARVSAQYSIRFVW